MIFKKSNSNVATRIIACATVAALELEVLRGTQVEHPVFWGALKRFPFVKFENPVPYEELNNLLCSSNIHFLFQKTEVVDTIMPSKILGMMASAKPSIITGNENSEVATIIKQSEGGYYYANNAPFSVYQTVLKLKNDSSLSKKIGENARAFILNKFSENQILLDFTLKINQVLS